MGLDMFLSAEVKAPAGSSLAKVIDENISEAVREEMTRLEPDYPDYVPYAYLSGWTFGDREPDNLYLAVKEELGFGATSESPSMHLQSDGSGGYYVLPTIFYWRKVNAIHHWFVDNAQGGVDECQRAEVHPELLADLQDRCERITADHAQAEALLPTRGGFFFGPTEYGDYYFQEIEETAKGLKAAIEQVGPHATRFIYQSSW